MSQQQLSIITSKSYWTTDVTACQLDLYACSIKLWCPLNVWVQSQLSKQDAELRMLQTERDALAAQLEGMRANLDTAASLAEEQVRVVFAYVHL